MQPREVEKAMIVKIVEGEAKGSEGQIVHVEESSFGRVWAKIALFDSGAVITKRSSDIEELQIGVPSVNGGRGTS